MPLFKGQSIDAFIVANQALFTPNGGVKKNAKVSFFSIDDFDEIKDNNDTLMEECDERMTKGQRDAALSKGEIVVAYVQGTGFVPFRRDSDGNILSAGEIVDFAIETRPIEPQKAGMWSRFLNFFFGYKTDEMKEYDAEKAEYDKQSMKFRQEQELRAALRENGKMTNMKAEYEKLENSSNEATKLQIVNNLLSNDRLASQVGLSEKKSSKKSHEKPSAEKGKEKAWMARRIDFSSTEGLIPGSPEYKRALMARIVDSLPKLRSIVKGADGEGELANYKQPLKNLIESNKYAINDKTRGEIEDTVRNQIKIVKKNGSFDKAFTQTELEYAKKIHSREIVDFMAEEQSNNIEDYKNIVPEYDWPNSIRPDDILLHPEENDEGNLNINGVFFNNNVKEQAEAPKAEEQTSEEKSVFSNYDTEESIEGQQVIMDATKKAYETLADQGSTKEQVNHAMATIIASSMLEVKSPEEMRSNIETGYKKSDLDDPETRNEIYDKSDKALKANAEKRYSIGETPEVFDKSIAEFENNPGFVACMNDSNFVAKHRGNLVEKFNQDREQFDGPAKGNKQKMAEQIMVAGYVKKQIEIASRQPNQNEPTLDQGAKTMSNGPQ